MENATLTNIQSFLADKPDLTLNRSDLEQTMMGATTLEAQIKDGAAKVKGAVSILAKLASTMVEFDPRFQIMPGTKALTSNVPKLNAVRPKSASHHPSRKKSPDGGRTRQRLAPLSQTTTNPID